MEGIRDGMAVDTCFVCGLLDRERAGQCARCGGRVRYRSARLADDVTVASAIDIAARQFRASPDQAAFEALAELLHDGGDEAVAQAAALGVELPELRAWWTEHGDGS